jgi:hypothetical protein
LPEGIAGPEYFGQGSNLQEKNSMRRYLASTILGVALLILFSTPQVRADSIDNFNYTEDLSGLTFSFTWQLPSSPTVDEGSYQPGVGFSISNVLLFVAIDDILLPPQFESFTFFASGLGGGFGYSDSAGPPLTQNLSPGQLYFDDANGPTFGIGTYGELDLSNGNVGTLVISTPEPTGLLLLGIGLLTLVVRLSLKKVFA